MLAQALPDPESDGTITRALIAAERVETGIAMPSSFSAWASDVPYHWFPFVPVQPPGTSALAGVIQLERHPLVCVLADRTVEMPEPRGWILVADEQFRIESASCPVTACVFVAPRLDDIATLIARW